jgi:hypothetical protein
MYLKINALIHGFSQTKIFACAFRANYDSCVPMLILFTDLTICKVL